MPTPRLEHGALRLRPLRPEDVELLVAARDVGSSPSTAGEQQVRRRIVRRIEASGRFHEGRLDFGIEVRGRLVGSIEARQPRGGLPPGAYEIGISFFEAAEESAISRLYGGIHYRFDIEQGVAQGSCVGQAVNDLVFRSAALAGR